VSVYTLHQNTYSYRNRHTHIHTHTHSLTHKRTDSLIHSITHTHTHILRLHSSKPKATRLLTRSERLIFTITTNSTVTCSDFRFRPLRWSFQIRLLSGTWRNVASRTAIGSGSEWVYVLMSSGRVGCRRQCWVAAVDVCVFLHSPAWVIALRPGGRSGFAVCEWMCECECVWVNVWVNVWVWVCVSLIKFCSVVSVTFPQLTHTHTHTRTLSLSLSITLTQTPLDRSHRSYLRTEAPPPIAKTTPLLVIVSQTHTLLLQYASDCMYIWMGVGISEVRPVCGHREGVGLLEESAREVYVNIWNVLEKYQNGKLVINHEASPLLFYLYFLPSRW